MTAFSELSEEGRMQKIRHHLSQDGAHPVPAPWVEWLLAKFDGATAKKEQENEQS